MNMKKVKDIMCSFSVFLLIYRPLKSSDGLIFGHCGGLSRNFSDFSNFLEKKFDKKIAILYNVCLLVFFGVPHMEGGSHILN